MLSRKHIQNAVSVTITRHSLLATNTFKIQNKPCLKAVKRRNERLRDSITAKNKVSHCRNAEKIHAITAITRSGSANHNKIVLPFAHITNILGHRYHCKLNGTTCVHFMHFISPGAELEHKSSQIKYGQSDMTYFRFCLALEVFYKLLQLLFF